MEKPSLYHNVSSLVISEVSEVKKVEWRADIQALVSFINFFIRFLASYDTPKYKAKILNVV